LGSRGFCLIPSQGLHIIISPNPRLLLPTKFVTAHSRKQNRSAIFKWQEKKQGWFLYEGEFPRGLEKGVKVVNLLVSVRKGSVSKSAKSKFAKKGKDVPKVCLEIVPYKGGLPPVGNIILKSTLPPSARAHSTRRSVVAKSRPPLPR